MDYKIKITTVLVIAYALFVLYIVVKRLRYWWTDVRGYKYYLVSNTFVTDNNGQNDINHYNLKIKARSENEALGIWHEACKDLIYFKKGKVSCLDWEEMTFYSSSK